MSLALRVSLLQQAKHARGVLDVRDEVILTNLTKVDLLLCSLMGAGNHLSVLICNGLDKMVVFVRQLYPVLVTHGHVLLH